MSLLEFYGKECPHCEKISNTIKELEKEEGIKVERIEIWHNEDNVKRMEEYDKGFCGGVPFLFNTKTGKWICGEATKKQIKNWAKGE